MLLSDLEHAVAEDSALRRRQRLQPAGGQGDKIFPPTYPGDGGPAHVFERRRIAGEEKVCVLIDSVQSQANRMEEALLAVAKAGHIRLPRLIVDFPGAGLDAIGPISVLEAPHRIFDAILRDSLFEGKPFRDSDLGERLKRAMPADATAILEAAPTALLFGAWNSTDEGGGIGAKFTRAITSEIIAIDAVIGQRAGFRIDPLGITSSQKVVGDQLNWRPAEPGDKDAKNPSEINHSNIIINIKAGNSRVSIWEQGVTCDHALQTLVLSFAGLRRLRFGTDPARDRAARTYLAALGIVAALEADRQGRALRSRCDLVCEGRAPLEIVAADGTVREVAIDADTAARLHEEAFDAACAAGFALNPEPVMLSPQPKLVELVRGAQEKALRDEGGEE